LISARNPFQPVPASGLDGCPSILWRKPRSTIIRALLLHAPPPACGAHRDGTTPIVMSPLEFMQRLAALVPRPRLHLRRSPGVLAPNTKLHSEIIPSSGRQTGTVPVPGFPDAPDANDKLADHGDAPPPSALARIRLMPGCSNGCLLSILNSVPTVAAP
jgi:hypothetical protein